MALMRLIVLLKAALMTNLTVMVMVVSVFHLATTVMVHLNIVTQAGVLIALMELMKD